MSYISGRATAEGTTHLLVSSGKVHPASQVWLGALGLRVSAVGLGTGQFPVTNEPTVVRRCAEVVNMALSGGINLIDCSSNYARGAAESVVGCVLADQIENGVIERSGVVICSKGGYMDEQEQKVDLENDWDRGECDHCLDPEFLHEQLIMSRKRLQVETIDLYFLHNPEEQFLRYGQEVFEKRVHRAFAFLEQEITDGRIAAYGVAGAEGFRIQGPCYHSIERLIELAESVGGPRHHFMVIQLPFSLAQPEAMMARDNTVRGERLSVLATAKAFGLAVIGSVSLNRMILPPRALAGIGSLCPELGRPEQAALNFARSAPGIDCALFGTSRPVHMLSALEVITHPPLDLTELT
jgi:aryl-alcohol dehydrogenase-like predicted oxidoreductase